MQAMPELMHNAKASMRKVALQIAAAMHALARHQAASRPPRPGAASRAVRLIFCCATCMHDPLGLAAKGIQCMQCILVLALHPQGHHLGMPILPTIRHVEPIQA